MESPFDILSIGSDADEAEIDRAYRRRAKETHPDQGGSAAEFRLVKAAYEEIKTGTGGRSFAATADRDEGDAHRRTESRVEYLNYEVLDDYGWELDDDDLFEKAAAEGVGSTDHGRISVPSHESLLAAAESNGCTWPYACRGGACANCAVAVVSGEVSVPVNHILTPGMVDRGIRLSCVGAPITEETKVVFNVKHLSDLDDLRLPPRPFEQAHLDD